MRSKVFIGGLNYRTTEKTLLDFLSGVGHVTSICIITDKETGKSKGFGFATFESKEDADKAIASLNGATLDERRIGIKEYIEKRRNVKI